MTGLDGLVVAILVGVLVLTIVVDVFAKAERRAARDERHEALMREIRRQP